jgi:hypothetical protein
VHYFIDACRLMQFATVLQMRCGDRMSAPKRRAIERFLRADGSVRPIPGLFARGARELARRRPETLGAEWMLAYAFTWRRLLGMTVRDHPQQTVRIDALPPRVLAPSPRARMPGDPDLHAVAERLSPLRLSVHDGAPIRINLLVPGPPFESTWLNLARRLAERGRRIRIVTVDSVGARPRLTGPFRAVEVEFGRESPGIEVSRADAFIATNWLSAHMARRALEALDGDRFLYLIREYEPLAMAADTFAALANESYGFPHAALYSSDMVREYFRRHRIGVYDDRASAVFEEAIPTVDPPTADELVRPGPRRLLFQAVGMFELGILALSRAGELGAFARDWNLYAVGARRSGRRLDLGGGDWMQLLPPVAPADYPALLRRHDLGIALMHAPQPGLVPIEMASAGMLAVTNTFETKTADALAAISANLIAAEPTVESIARAVCAATAAIDDVERRVRGSRVRWSRDWDESFGDELLDRVIAFLTA